MRESEEIRILIVEDTEKKLEEIKQQLNQPHLFADEVKLEISEADCFSVAQSLLETKFFDVIILDLKIPIMPGGDARLEHSKSLYQFIRDLAPSKPFYVLGLTSVTDKEVAKVFTQTPNFTIQKYDVEGNWLKHLVNRISFVIGAKTGLSEYLNNNFGTDVIIITARKKNEFDPIVNHIDWLGGYHAPKTVLDGVRNTFGSIALSNGVEISLGVVCLDEMGLSHSASVTSNLISLFRPKHLAMLGMCCGLRKITDPKKVQKGSKCKLGDIIVARNTCCWDEGKYEDDDPKLLSSAFFNNRAIDKYPDPSFWKHLDRFLDENETSLETDVTELYNSYDLKSVQNDLVGNVVFSPNAKLLWGGMVSGGCVIDSEKMISEIEERFPRAIGLEMEAHSVYSAVNCSFGLKPSVVVIKGVADFGDGTKAKPVQAMASIGSFVVYQSMLEHFSKIDKLG